MAITIAKINKTNINTHFFIVIKLKFINRGHVLITKDQDELIPLTGLKLEETESSVMGLCINGIGFCIIGILQFFDSVSEKLAQHFSTYAVGRAMTILEIFTTNHT